MAEAAADDPRHLTIRVIDESEQPVPGAEVGWYVARDGEDYRRDPTERESLAFAGETERSDERGHVRIPVTDVMSWTVYGRDDGRFGVRFVPLKAVGQVHDLRLRPDVTIRARVTDPSGRPAPGVRVVLLDEAGVEKNSGLAFRETAEPDGIATFHHAQQVVRPDWGSDCAVMIGSPIGRPVFAPVNLEAVAAEPYELQLPGTGSIHIELVDRDGQAVRDLTERVYARLFELQPDSEVRFRSGFDGARLDLAHVGLGLRFRLELSSPDVRGVLEFDGPKQWGERVEHRLPVSRNPTLSGRLVDVQGVPQKGYWHATHVQTSRGYHNQYFETGSDGRFHTAIPELHGGLEKSERGVIFKRTITDRTQQAFLEFARLGLHDGRNELGDVVLRAAPVLVAGRIVDDTGDPVAGARVRVLQGDPAGEVWTLGGLPDSDDLSGEDGGFVIRAHHIGNGLLLRADQSGNTGSMMPVIAGSEGVEYVLPRVGSASMRVTFEAGLTPADLLFCHVDTARRTSESVVSYFVMKDDVAHWRALKSGRYDFLIRMIGSPSPLVAIRDVEIANGKNVELPAQRLGAELHSLIVRVVDDEGRPVERASLVVDPAALGDRPRAALPTELGERRIRVVRLPVDLQVLAPGFRVRTVRGVGQDVTVRMQRGLLVDLRVKLPVGFPAADQQLQPILRRYDRADPNPEPWGNGHRLYLRGEARLWYPEHHSWLWSPNLRLDRDGRAAFRVPAPGEYELGWELRGEGRRDLSDRTKRIIAVSEADGPTRVELELSAADVR
ncbi:MAG: carboxypeptidase-like regulatory domain-containing protein [bacterium]|nr:carboxypeptidase-like regulatory domain-containing protein [bacterium]